MDAAPRAEAAGGVSEQGVVSELMLRLNKVKRIDMKIAIDVAGVANLAVRDMNGNLLPIVWTRQSVHNEYENATLLTRDALQKHLQTFIDAGVKENIEILQRVEDPALLVDWVVRTAEYWEKRYAAKRDEKYDISQSVFSSMFEAVCCEHVVAVLESRGFRKVAERLKTETDQLLTGQNRFHKQLLTYIADNAGGESHTELESFFWLHRGTSALVRLLFRSDCIPELRERLCILAGKLLQRKEVVNKAGAYSSVRQRSDVVQEFRDEMDKFLCWVHSWQDSSKLLAVFEKEDWIFLVIDHTALPITLSHIPTPPVRLADGQEPVCARCSQGLGRDKRRRVDAEDLDEM